MKVKFAVLGDAFVDVVAGTLAPDQLPQWGSDVECSRPIELQPGGSALNTATHLANLSVRNPHHELEVALHTAVGNDSFANVLKTHLADRNVTLSSPMLDNVPTGVCIVLSGAVIQNDRSFITHYGAAHRLNIEKAKENGITTSLDINYDSTEKWDGLDELFPLIDIFLPNEIEAMKISRTDSVSAAMAHFTERINGVTVIKVGAGGAIAYCSKTQQQWKQGSFPTDVVDVTGAGDSFNSGFLFAWKTNDGDVGDALRWGCGTASRTVAALGACSFPLTYEDVQSMVAVDNARISSK
ncbi:Ribokinase [Phytophthora nicotianae]|uniref:Ribokinase n=1 Tax=Phytophthora nicotianae TaxID=4792 RepID=A0A0W8DP68_PHYNI|nr:Ribokinase [Phytophthora nicotianae]